jgi:pimeloyl-ACP methyl ester carboxylesterase
MLMKSIYCISGFGADERVFSKLNFGEYDVRYIPWLMPEHKEKIETYATRMTAAIRHKDPVLMGLSFGGMMAIEMSKLISYEKVIIISSVKTKRELPRWMRWTGLLGLHKIVPLRSFAIIKPLENHNLGIETKEEMRLVKSYRRHIEQKYTNWAVNQIVNWKNGSAPERMIHIHGGRDHIFPLRNIKADYVIPDGGHFMIMNRADKINIVLDKILRNKPQENNGIYT